MTDCAWHVGVDPCSIKYRDFCIYKVQDNGTVRDFIYIPYGSKWTFLTRRPFVDGLMFLCRLWQPLRR